MGGVREVRWKFRSCSGDCDYESIHAQTITTSIPERAHMVTARAQTPKEFLRALILTACERSETLRPNDDTVRLGISMLSSKN